MIQISPLIFNIEAYSAATNTYFDEHSFSQILTEQELGEKSFSSPLSILAYGKLASKNIDIVKINDLLISIERKIPEGIPTEFKSLIAHLWLYGYEYEATSATKIFMQGTQNSHVGLIGIMDLANFMFIMDKDIRTLELVDKRLSIIKNKADKTYDSLLNTLNVLGNYHNKSEYITSTYFLLNHLKTHTSNLILNDCYDQAVSRAIMSYTYNHYNSLYYYINKMINSGANFNTVKANKIKTLLSNEYLNTVSMYIEKFGPPSLIDKDKNDNALQLLTKLDSMLQRFQLLLESELPTQSWSEYQSLPISWVEGIVE